MVKELVTWMQTMQDFAMEPVDIAGVASGGQSSYSALVSSKLAADGIDAQVICVDKRAEFEAALEQGEHDLIIADYSLPDYNGIYAMKLALQKAPATPILLVSGTIGEEAAIESLRAGATDYVLKQWPARLIPALRRALRESEERKNRLRAESALERREKLFLALSENALDIVTVINQECVIFYASPSRSASWGISLRNSRASMASP